MGAKDRDDADEDVEGKKKDGVVRGIETGVVGGTLLLGRAGLDAGAVRR